MRFIVGLALILAPAASAFVPRHEPAELIASWKAHYDVETLDEMIAGLKSPDPYDRWDILAALWSLPSQRPDFEAQLLPRLRQASEIGARDADMSVRAAAGTLSQSIEHWSNFQSPQALAARASEDRSESIQDAVSAIVYALLSLSLTAAALRGILSPGGRRRRGSRRSHPSPCP
ncbi:MAG: hypothetical protein HY549_05930 [Elusimicrobia bacterium]|nr:hypothetical protein [Elusimicrobiota bacterium]